MKVLLLCFLLLTVGLHSSTVNRTSQTVPTDPQLAFLATGGGVGGLIDLFWDIPGHVKPFDRWGFRLPVEVGQAWLIGYALQSQTGAVPTQARDLNYANCAAFGAAGLWLVTSYRVQW